MARTVGLDALSVVVPSYNTRDILEQTLRTLRREVPEVEVIVVDGSSADDSATMVEQLFPEYRVLRTPNHGFAHAVNRGLEAATRSHYLLLNSDIFVTRGALESMLDSLTDPRTGAVAPVLINPDGSPQPTFGAFYWPNWVRIRRETKVWLLPGACVMTRRDVVDKVGALDETFFLYNEEYDFCARLRAGGFEMRLVPESVVHLGGASTSAKPSPLLTLEAQRGFLYLASKHAPPIGEALRAAMHVQGRFFGRFSQHAEWRSMWRQLASLTERGAYEESPFQLSGRGCKPAMPQATMTHRSNPDESGLRAVVRRAS